MVSHGTIEDEGSASEVTAGAAVAGVEEEVAEETGVEAGMEEEESS